MDLSQVDLSFLPAVNAGLNSLATVLLVLGLVFIKKQMRQQHKAAMIGAFACSCVFLACYLTHYVWRASVVGGTHTPYNGPAKPLYLIILLTHILLAMVVPFFAVALIYLGLREKFEKHKKLARVAWPVWFYVSVTGVVIYFMLYHLNAPAPVTQP